MASLQEESDVHSTWAASDGASNTLSHHVRVRQAHGGDQSVVLLAPMARLRLVPGPEREPCEVTVKFQQRQHSIHHIQVLSSARTCEAYRQNEGDTDVEYLCTARGQLQLAEEVSKEHLDSDGGQVNKIESTKLLFEANMEVEDLDPCMSVTIRLLSLEDKSHVFIEHIIITVTPGPFLAGSSQSYPAPMQQGFGGSNSASSLAAFAPLMLQMAQGMSIPDVRNSIPFMSSSRAEGLAENPPPQLMSSIPHRELVMHTSASQQEPPASEEISVPVTTPQGVKSAVSLDNVCERLDKLESVCARIEESLAKTLESFHKRLEILETGLGRFIGIG